MGVVERFTTIASSTGISRTAVTSTLSIQSFEKERGRRWLDSGIRFSANIFGDNPAVTNSRAECDRNSRRSILALPPKCEPDYTTKRTGAWSEHKTTRLTKGHEGKAIRISFLRELRVLCGSLNFGRVVAGQVHSLPAPTGSRMCGATVFEGGG